MNKNNIILSISIIISSIILASSLIYYTNSKTAYTTADGINMEKAIEDGIEQYIIKQEKEYNKKQAEIDRLGEKIEGVPPLNEGDYIKGNKNAKISIIEYSDLDCPFCKKFHTTGYDVLNKYEGEVNWVWRHLPLTSIHPNSNAKSELAECAGKIKYDNFWKVIDYFMNEGFDPNQNVYDHLDTIAKITNTNKESLEKCIKEGEFEDKVKISQGIAGSIGINGTPGNVIINNKTNEAYLRAGAYDVNTISNTIDYLLQQ